MPLLAGLEVGRGVKIHPIPVTGYYRSGEKMNGEHNLGTGPDFI